MNGQSAVPTALAVLLLAAANSHWVPWLAAIPTGMAVGQLVAILVALVLGYDQVTRNELKDTFTAIGGVLGGAVFVVGGFLLPT